MTDGLDALPSDGTAFSAAAFRTLVRAELVSSDAPGHVDAPGRQLSVGALAAVPDVAGAWIYGLYAVVLDRLPDDEGLQAHTSALRAGASPAELMRSMQQSDEAARLKAAAPEAARLKAAAPETDEAETADADADETDRLEVAFVTGAYLVGLGRPPDLAGLDTHIDLLRRGASHQNILDALIMSPEAVGANRFPRPRPRRARAVAASLKALRRPRPDSP
jgi:hypothetical protein